MSKKHTTEVATIDTPQITNNISMNLNQNDLVDMVVQERITQLEKELEVLNTQLKDKSIIETARNERIRVIILESMPAECKPVLDAINKLGKKDLLKIEVGTVINGEEVAKYEYMRSHSFENANRPLQIFKVNTRAEYYSIFKVKNVHFRLRVVGSGFEIFSNSFVLSFSAKQSKALTDFVSKEYKEKAALLNIIHERTRELLELQYNERKVKSAFVKAHLAKSADGKNILKFLEKATKVNLSLP